MENKIQFAYFRVSDLTNELEKERQKNRKWDEKYQFAVRTAGTVKAQLVEERRTAKERIGKLMSQNAQYASMFLQSLQSPNVDGISLKRKFVEEDMDDEEEEEE
ncbi:hypothetical protein PMAYCL1PPCAC_20759, partial [Pristionchus mayeri]